LTLLGLNPVRNIRPANLCEPNAVQPLQIAIQPSISTIPCNSLYLLANPVLPFLMFRSQINLPRSFQGFSASGLATRHSSLATAPLTPFLATLTGHPQLGENPATLSLFTATLTRHVHHNPFVCRSYKKHPGSHLSSQRSFRAGFSRPNFFPTHHSPPITKSFTIRTSKTQDLKPSRMNTYEKTGVGASSPAFALLVRPTTQALIPKGFPQ
jgi:hypothetical protein